MDNYQGNGIVSKKHEEERVKAHLGAFGPSMMSVTDR
jgi:hypothetical protein